MISTLVICLGSLKIIFIIINIDNVCYYFLKYHYCKHGEYADIKSNLLCLMGSDGKSVEMP